MEKGTNRVGWLNFFDLQKKMLLEFRDKPCGKCGSHKDVRVVGKWGGWETCECTTCRKSKLVWAQGKPITVYPDSRTERSFVTYKSIMRDRKENEKTCKEPHWEMKRLQMKKKGTMRRRENHFDLIKNMLDLQT